MRFTRLLAFATWVVIALLAMAAFAAFSPSGEFDELGAPTTVDDVGEAEAIASGPGIGAAAGRQAAFGFSQDMLSLAVPETTTTTTTIPATTTTSVTPTTTSTTTTISTTTTTRAPTTATTAVPKPTRAPLPPDQVHALVSAHFQPADVEKAVLVAWCESRYDANATNPTSGAAGLFQHLPRYWAGRSQNAGVGGADIYDPAANTAVAAWLVYSNGGWKHWNPSISCWGNASVVAPSTTTTTTPPPETTTTSAPPTTVPAAPTTTTTTLPPPTTTTIAVPGPTTTTIAP